MALILVLLLTVVAGGIGQHDHSTFKTTCHACSLGHLAIGQPSVGHRVSKPGLLGWRSHPKEQLLETGTVFSSDDTRGPPSF